MGNREFNYRKLVVFTIVIICITVGIIYGIDRSVRESRREAVLSRIQNVADYQISNLIRTYANYTAEWGYLIRLNRGTVPEFASLAHKMFLEWDDPAIISIRLAPAGIVGPYVYPSDGEIHVNLFEAPDRKREAMYSRMTGEMTVTGPMTYYPHDQEEIIVRNPLYLDGENGARGSFWGFAILVLDHRKMLQYTEFSSPNLLYDYKVKPTVGHPGDARTITESDEEPLTDPVLYEFPVADTTWTIEAAWHGGWITAEEMTMEWGIGAAVVLISVLIFVFAENQRRLRVVSFTDGLTQVRNRSALSAAFDDIYKKGKHINVLMFDIDYFKEVNDTYGHAAGDHVLRTVGGYLDRIFRQDRCYRYGGDEFLVIDDSDEATMREKIECLRWSLDRVKFELQPLHLTISGGCVSGIANSKEDLRTMLRRADKKLYESKKAGKNSVQYETVEPEENDK